MFGYRRSDAPVFDDAVVLFDVVLYVRWTGQFFEHEEFTIHVFLSKIIKLAFDRGFHILFEEIV